MRTSKFSFTELKEQLENIDTDAEKIEFISLEVIKCKDAIQDAKYYAANFETMEIKLTIKAPHQETLLTEVLNTDRRIKREATRKIMKLCAQKLCDEFNNYLERAEVLLKHYKTKLDARARSFEYSDRESKFTLTIGKKCIRIIWKLGKEKLLSLFVQLNLNEIVPKYSKEEILAHFTDEKQNSFGGVWGNNKKFNWYDSDCAFAVFVDELSKRGAIEDENKYKVFGQHFLNKQGNSFKDLPQKRNYTENFTKTGDFIRKILNDAKI
ncbi:MAG: hypothetical protein FD122_3031 [Stygiobacter sp.]|nr:MAG: hypothetical protein FD122_3031 [Stygiobacter sp.]KAF0215426.1 MAG: hypothetical protein FD178_1710 [Ignavibacteria bacterium]